MSTLQTDRRHQNGILQAAATANVAAAQAQATAHDAAAAARAHLQHGGRASRPTCRSRSPPYQAVFNRLSAAEKQVAAPRPTAGGSRASRADRPAARALRPDRGQQPGGADRRRHRPGPAGQALRLGGRRPRLLRLLRADRVRLRRGRASACRTRRPCSRRWARRCRRADLQPGDLVFFYSPVSHVGIYIGNGQMVHAPTTGDVVKISNIDVDGLLRRGRRIAG